MPDETPAVSATGWMRAIDAAAVRAERPVAVKLAGKHIALFKHGDEILACNNRCPHEGYPLVEGALDAQCKLTCHWHNWKFDLRSGRNEYGGDNLRTYPVRIDGSDLWIDVSDPPSDLRIANALAGIDDAMADVDTARIARELARLIKVRASPERALRRAIEQSHVRLRYGMTHAYAGADAWCRLADRLTDPAERLACMTEALAHIAFDVRGEASAPYAAECRPWDDAVFAAAAEAQDESLAIALIGGALDGGLRFADLEAALTSAALAHYADFGHTLIYLTHVRRLIDRLGRDAERPLLFAWVRSLMYSTREDLLPDFHGYSDALREWPDRRRSSAGSTAPSHIQFEGTSVRDALAATLRCAQSDPIAVHDALFETAARQLLRFDESHAIATVNPVADNVGWLDFSHALTFAHALREQCTRLPDIADRFWPAGLLQLALFVGRNKAYLSGTTDSDAELERWGIADEAEFHRRASATLIDHGIGLPIFPVHWLKTWTAVRDEAGLGLSAGARRAGLASVNRLLAVRFKQRHTLRAAHQALGFVARED